jgi:alginate biosynthesis protein AlgX
MMRVIALAAISVLMAAPLAAQSAFGCTDLDGRHAIPSVEGTDGMFYRVHPDLHMFQPFSDQSITDLARLSDALSDMGTTLIYVPLPTKALIEPESLPVRATDLGFDVSIATTVFDDIIHRLVEADVLAVNLRGPLRATGDEGPSVFLTDYRLNTDGGRRAAAAIGAVIAATPGVAGLARGTFTSRAAGTITLPSTMRDILQRHCTLTIPEAVTASATTSRTGGTLPRTEGLLGGAGAAQIALVGTEDVASFSSNLAGFLSEATGLDALEYTVYGGGSFAAISAYLTSRSFQEARPAYLVWINPVQNNLAQWGDQPLGELVAAAAGTCRIPLPAGPGLEPQTLVVDLLALDPGRSYTLYIDADTSPATVARFDILSPSGLVHTRHIQRNPDQTPTGRFYLPLTGLWPDGAQSVTVTLDAVFGVNARAAACPE